MAHGISRAAAPSPARVAFASLIGTAVEWYDFFLFGICAALIFPKAFFPSQTPAIALLASFATFGVAFLARPLGAVFFGHLGDTVGRKSALVTTLLLMGLATCLIGVVPSYETSGIWGAVILVALRLCQGFAIGGEWGGAALMAIEHSPEGKRGFYGVFSQIGNPIGFFLCNAVLQVVIWLTSEDAFLRWGWRIGFLMSAVLVIIGLYVRLNITDAAIFTEAKARQAPAHRKPVPIKTLFRDHWNVLLRTVCLQAAFSVGSYALISFYGAYTQRTLGLPSSWVLISGMVGAVVSIPFYFYFARMSDRIGRRGVYLMGIGAWLLIAFPFYWLINTSSLWGVIAASSLAWALGHAGTYAVQSSYLSECFPTEIRYTGISISYQLASVLWSAPSSFVAVWLFTRTGSIYAVSGFVAAAALLALLALATMRETYRSDLRRSGDASDPLQ
ncbi:MFS transporter [Chitinasiproducens palmae]|uniref:Predicted arabinose efflux permease, MFS family n=1 Tax=Chitinasiproducens palmae TaxID=1770053 RepID=A0A1H2PW44_9BURK|nr:MFS transporter [Chitinasiproducens palmae]SDV51560.1 Predicted arabinose efflux permease, MFS family [Chitinasiproducens palmae]